MWENWIYQKCFGGFPSHWIEAVVFGPPSLHNNDTNSNWKTALRNFISIFLLNIFAIQTFITAAPVCTCTCIQVFFFKHLCVSQENNANANSVVLISYLETNLVVLLVWKLYCWGLLDKAISNLQFELGIEPILNMLGFIIWNKLNTLLTPLNHTTGVTWPPRRCNIGDNRVSPMNDKTPSECIILTTVHIKWQNLERHLTELCHDVQSLETLQSTPHFPKKPVSCQYFIE